MPGRSLPDQFERVAPPWDALADAVRASPFRRPGWIGAWWRAFGGGKLEVLTHSTECAAAAVMPIVFRHGAALSPSNWHSPEFGGVYSSQATGAAVIEALFERRPQLISLRLLDASDAPLGELLAAAEQSRYHAAVRTLADCPVAELEGDWSSYERELSRNLRRDVQRCRRRLAELGAVTLEVSRSAGDIEEALMLERLGWRGAQRTAIASHAHTRRFYNEIARWAEQRGWLRLVFLRAGARRVAFHLALEYADSYVPLKGGFDPAVPPAHRGS